MKKISIIGKKAIREVVAVLVSILIVFAFLLIPTTLTVLAIKLMVSGFSLFLNAAGISLIVSVLFVLVLYVKDLFDKFKTK